MIYFDNAATTKIYPDVAEFICKHSQEEFYNPSGLYFPSLKVQQELQNARVELLNLLNASNSKVVFTASATEANNLALRCFVDKNKKILISEGEHSCVYQTAMYLKNNGVNVDFIKLTPNGVIDIEDLKTKLTEDVGLVSFIYVSNETGTINDAKQICSLIKEKCPKAIVHCDGVQAFGKIPVNLNYLGVDMFTISSHKIHGPRGVGALIFKNNLNPKPIIFGGGQEYDLRSGTENSSAILGFVMASKIMLKNLDKNMAHINKLKQTLLSKIQEINPVVNGDINNSSPNILSLSFEDVKGEVLVHMLEGEEIYIGTGSSCNSKHTGNRVMMAMGKTKQEEAGNIRISFCEENTLEEIDVFAKSLINNVNKIKELKIWKK